MTDEVFADHVTIQIHMDGCLLPLAGDVLESLSRTDEHVTPTSPSFN